MLQGVLVKTRWQQILLFSFSGVLVGRAECRPRLDRQLSSNWRGITRQELLEIADAQDSKSTAPASISHLPPSALIATIGNGIPRLASGPTSLRSKPDATMLRCVPELPGNKSRGRRNGIPEQPDGQSPPPVA